MKNKREQKSTLYGIGVGPGDPQLITLKALNIIKKADIIAYPCQEGGKSIAYNIAQKFIPHDAQKLPLQIPITTHHKTELYDRAAKTLLSHLKKNKNIAYLCEGDPLFYGSFIYILERIKPLHPTIIIPGVSTITAISAATTKVLARREESLHVIPATQTQKIIEEIIEKYANVIIIKVGRHFDKIHAIWQKNAHKKHAFLIENASREGEKITPLEATPKGVKPYFSTILITAQNKIS